MVNKDIIDFSILNLFYIQKGLGKKLGLFKLFERCLMWDGLKLILMVLLKDVQTMLPMVTF